MYHYIAIIDFLFLLIAQATQDFPTACIRFFLIQCLLNEWKHCVHRAYYIALDICHSLIMTGLK